MANKNILTTASKTVQVGLNFYSPVATVPPYGIPLGTTYCFLSKVTSWDDDNNPPAPTADVKYEKQVMKNMFVAKLLTSNDICPVIERIDWANGIVYGDYRDDIDILASGLDDKLIYKFYIKNRYDQVFKCLWNNNGEPSTVEPYFEPGSYGTNNIFKGADKYKWKYMYTIDTSLSLRFMDKTWMPVVIGANTPNPLMTAAGAGSLDVMNVTDGGSGYDPTNSAITITISGDGTGAIGVANVQGGIIDDIIVTNPGTNYTYSDITITSASGSGAKAFANTSPVGGHGFDPVSELGCSHVMFTSEFNGSEGGVIPTDINYYQLGLVINPTSRDSILMAQNLGVSESLPANGVIYKTTTDLIVAPGFGTYLPDEIVFQGPTDNIQDATFIATVLSFDVATNVLNLINTTGTPIPNTPVKNTPKTNRTLLSYTTPNYSVFSGYMVYIENRSGVQRSEDGIEQVRIVLGY